MGVDSGWLEVEKWGAKVVVGTIVGYWLLVVGDPGLNLAGGGFLG